MKTHPAKLSWEKWTKWGRLENRFCHLMTETSDGGFWTGLVGVVTLHVLLVAYLPPAEDELYYWTWAQNLSSSYYDHPPMVAWWIKFTTMLFGSHLWAIRLPTIFVHCFLLSSLAKICQNSRVLTYLLWTPLSLYGAVFMTPDVPLLFFWMLYFMWIIDLETQILSGQPVKWRSWAYGGCVLGLGLLSKYTMALAPLCLGTLLIIAHSPKLWILGFSAQLILGFICFIPVLIFNQAYDFTPLLFQWNHTQTPASFTFFLDFLGTQIALVGALPVLLLPWIFRRVSALNRNPLLRSSAFLFLLPFMFFLFKSTHSFLEANWALVAYLGFWPLANYYFTQPSPSPLQRLFLFTSFFIPLIVSVLLGLHLFSPLPFIPPHRDRLAKLTAQFHLAQEVEHNGQLAKDITLYSPTYQWTSYFRFLGFKNAQQLKGVGRDSHFTLNPDMPCSHEKIYFFKEGAAGLPTSLACFTEQKTLFNLPLVVRNQSLSHWVLMELSQKSGTL